MSQRWIRSQRASVVEIGDAMLLVARDGTVHRLADDSAELAGAVLDHVGTPRSEAEVLAHVEELAGEPLGERVAVVRQLLALLAETGSVTHPRQDTHRRPGCNIVVGVCGAIAASAAPALVTALQRRGHTVEVAVTPTASRFVALDALTAIVQREPQTSMWPRAPHLPVPHVALAAWADLVVVYPATATTIARLAHGDFSELVAATALTTRAPVVIVPSMNPDMLSAPAVERNLAQLRDDGFAIIRGVPADEVADPPSLRDAQAGAAPAPGEVAATIDVLLAADVLARRDPTPSTNAWQAVYRGAASSPDLLPWASDRCDDDLAAMLVAHAPRPPARLLDLGCGLGQVARHAAAAGYRVVATDIAEAALELARDRTPRNADIVWLRDDIGASSLVGPFDVIIDRATLHTLSSLRAHAWAASIGRVTASGSVVIVKAHRDGITGATHGYSAERIAALLPEFELLASRAAELPGLREPAPIPSTLAVLRRR